MSTLVSEHPSEGIIHQGRGTNARYLLVQHLPAALVNSQQHPELQKENTIINNEREQSHPTMPQDMSQPPEHPDIRCGSSASLLGPKFLPLLWLELGKEGFWASPSPHTRTPKHPSLASCQICLPIACIPLVPTQTAPTSALERVLHFTLQLSQPEMCMPFAGFIT